MELKEGKRYNVILNWGMFDNEDSTEGQIFGARSEADIQTMTILKASAASTLGAAAKYLSAFFLMLTIAKF